jgi:hypothetical protein
MVNFEMDDLENGLFWIGLRNTKNDAVGTMVVTAEGQIVSFRWHKDMGEFDELETVYHLSFE